MSGSVGQVLDPSATTHHGCCRRHRLEGRDGGHGPHTQFQTTQKHQDTLPDRDQKNLDAFSRVADQRIQVIPPIMGNSCERADLLKVTVERRARMHRLTHARAELRVMRLPSAASQISDTLGQLANPSTARSHA